MLNSSMVPSLPFLFSTCVFRHFAKTILINLPIKYLKNYNLRITGEVMRGVLIGTLNSIIEVAEFTSMIRMWRLQFLSGAIVHKLTVSVDVCEAVG